MSTAWTGLTINDRENLDLTPCNLTVEELVGLLEQGNAVHVVLQPGDMTRYEFVIVPLVGQLERVGGYGTDGFPVLHVSTNLAIRGSCPGVHVAWGAHESDFADSTTNEHSAAIYAAFYNALRGEIVQRDT